MAITCRYCATFAKGVVISNDKGIVTRFCSVLAKDVSSTTESCRRFSPATGFYCQELNFRTSLEVCLNRRKNKKGYEAWNYCKKCRQFALEVEPIVKKFLERKIKRRNSNEPAGWFPRKRVISRRDLQSIIKEEVRKIRRR